MKLKQYIELWDEALVKGNSPREVALVLGMEPKRVEMYREFVQGHYEGSLEKMYPRVKDSVNEQTWESWFKGYFQEFPPTAYELNALCKDFPEYLKSQGEAVRGELAEYEWAEFQTYMHKADETLLPLKGEYALNPTLYAMSLKYDILGYVRDEDEDKNPSLPKEKPGLLFIVRHPESRLCVFTEASALALHIVNRAAEGNVKEDELLSLAGENSKSELNFLVRQSILLQGKG